jgi:3-oxoacyl-[acyl-carrier protein] reductase
MKLKNKVALVVGGGTGIGKAISLEFANEGADICVSSRDINNLNKVCKEVQQQGRKAIAVPADVCNKKQVDNMVQIVIEKFGHIDILVNNAGTNRIMPLIDFAEEDWDTVINTNLKGVFLCTQAVVKHMMKRKYGKIINIASTSALGCSYAMGESAYVSSKFAVIGFTKAAAVEFGQYGINVNAICPGRILTPLVYSTRTPEQVDNFVKQGKDASILGRLGSVKDIAQVALFLASDDSSFITAETIASNGGRINVMSNKLNE